MPQKARVVIAALERKGFRRSNSKDKRFIYYLTTGEKGSRSTMVSHGESEISDNLLSKMARQMGLSKEKFDDFVECTLSQAGYEELAEE